MEQLDSLYIAE